MKNVYYMFGIIVLITFSMISFSFAQTESIESNLTISSLPAGVSIYQLDNGMVETWSNGSSKDVI